MTEDERSIDTIVVGAGQAGLMMSRHLSQAGRDHLVLERRPTLGGGWQDRWDGFLLVSPNWISGLPGYPYEGDDPDGYMPGRAMAERVARYAQVIGAPVELETDVLRLQATPTAGRRFRLATSQGVIGTDHVIVATGGFHVPRIPEVATGFDPGVLQLHSHDYRSPERLPPGGVLIVGSGQTGVQLAEELHASGRKVVLSTSHCGRMARRYRGYDIFWWVRQLAERGEVVGAALPTVDQLPDPRMRFACNPHMSGHGGGHDTNLRQFAQDGIRLTGRLVGAEGRRAVFARDLTENLAFADGFFDRQLTPLLETYAAATGVALQDDDRAWPTTEPPEVDAIDLDAEDIGTVLWTTGYRRDDRWIELPIHDGTGIPRQRRGVTDVPGLSFLGMVWQWTNASANLSGMHLDAAHVAAAG